MVDAADPTMPTPRELQPLCPLSRQRPGPRTALLLWDVFTTHGSPHPERRRQSAGYTLVELSIAVVVTAILAAIAVPAINDVLQQQRALAVANRICSDLNWARQYAVSSARAQTLRFDTAGNKYSWDGMTDPDNPTAAYSVSLASSNYQARLVSANFGGDGIVVFDVHGAADSDGTVTVSAGSATGQVQLTGRTGAANVP